ncbi:ArgE/DapE family deacylase [Lachnospiraceae bacterium 54-53]
MTKKELLEYVDDHSEELIRLVSELIQKKSENPTGTQRDVIDYVEAYLKEAGIDYEETGCNPDFPCVVAGIGNGTGFSMIMNGHVDVVPAGDIKQWDFDPFSGEITDTQILGRGTSDMKAGVAGVLFALSLFARKQVPLKGNLRLHIVSDEESGGQFGTQWLCANGYADHADACLVAEPTSMNTIEIGQKGGLLLTVKSYGKSAHGSLGNYKGENAILKLSRVLSNISMLTEIKGHFTDRQQKPLRDSQMLAERENNIPGLGRVIDHVSTNVGLIRGGTRHNMVPDYCEATVDVRLPIGVGREEIEEVLERIREASGEKGVEYELQFKSEANFTDHEAPIVLAFKKNAEELLGKEVIPAYQWASSDARDYRMLGIPTIQFGPSNTVGIHSYNETVQIGDVITAAKTYIGAVCDLMDIK